MKQITLILALILLPNFVLADGWQVPYPNGTPRAQVPAAGTPVSPNAIVNRANVDTQGNVMVVPGPNASGTPSFPVVPSSSNATNTLLMTSTSSAFVLVNSGYATLSVETVAAGNTGLIQVNCSPLTDGTLNWTLTGRIRGSSASTYQGQTSSLNIASTNIDLFNIQGCASVQVKVSSAGTGTQTVYTSLQPPTSDMIGDIIPGVAALNLGKAEDAPAVSGDTGMFALGVRGDGLTSVTSNSGDYSQLTVNSAGVLDVALTGDPNISSTIRATQREDAAAGDGDTGFAPLSVRTDTAGTPASNGDYQNLVSSVSGGLIADIDYNFQASATKGLMKLEDAVAVSSDSGVMMLGDTNEAGNNRAAADDDYITQAYTRKGYGMNILVYDGNMSSATSAVRLEDSVHTSGDAGLPVWAVRDDGGTTTFTNTNGDYSPIGVASAGGAIYDIPKFDGNMSDTNAPIKREDGASSDQAAGILGLVVYQANPTQSAGTVGDYSTPENNDIGALYADIIRRNTFTVTQPTVTNATSFTCLASSSARRNFLIQNNSAANIMINPNNGTLTGIVPTATNLGIVLTPGSSYSSPAASTPTAAITCYQTSGGSINTISVLEQQ